MVGLPLDKGGGAWCGKVLSVCVCQHLVPLFKRWQVLAVPCFWLPVGQTPILLAVLHVHQPPRVEWGISVPFCLCVTLALLKPCLWRGENGIIPCVPSPSWPLTSRSPQRANRKFFPQSLRFPATQGGSGGCKLRWLENGARHLCKGRGGLSLDMTAGGRASECRGSLAAPCWKQ